MDDSAICQLMAMGYEHEDVINALNAANQDLPLATQYLIEGLPTNKKNAKQSESSNKSNKSSQNKDDVKLNETVSNLMSMGFEYNDVIKSLKVSQNDQQRAVQWLLNKDKKQQNANNPNKPQKIDGDKSKKGGNNNNNNKNKKTNSGYYLYASTNKEEAVKYRPKKIEHVEHKKNELILNKNKKGSTWNTGATMEQFDYTEWMKQRLKYLLKNNIQFKSNRNTNDSLKIHEIINIDGSATFLLIRNRLRPGFDINFECKWNGDIQIDNQLKKVEGKLIMSDITSEDDPDDWEYHVIITENLREYRIAKSIISHNINKQAVLNVLDAFIKEFKAKKK